MPLNLSNLQGDYSAAKATLATLQTAVDAVATALLAHEQACEALEADGWAQGAAWFRQSAALTTEGYQVFGNCNPVTIYARKPGVARDLSAPNSIGPIISSQAYKDLQALCGFNLTP